MRAARSTRPPRELIPVADRDQPLARIFGELGLGGPEPCALLQVLPRLFGGILARAIIGLVRFW